MRSKTRSLDFYSWAYEFCPPYLMDKDFVWYFSVLFEFPNKIIFSTTAAYQWNSEGKIKLKSFLETRRYPLFLSFIHSCRTFLIVILFSSSFFSSVLLFRKRRGLNCGHPDLRCRALDCLTTLDLLALKGGAKTTPTYISVLPCTHEQILSPPHSHYINNKPPSRGALKTSQNLVLRPYIGKVG